MTRKLYYEDAYIRSFDAEVISCTECEGKYLIVLDSTAFFPEEGGQSADTGWLADVRVSDVYEEKGIIYHVCDSALLLGQAVGCKIDFDKRFEKMQCHTAEHIVCGIINNLYGFENVGFHLGEDYVTFDIDGVLTREMLDEVENIANQAVFENVEVKAYFPSRSELSELKYRSKIISENVDIRMVSVDGYDICACCAPHVSRTGEIGLIKLLDFEKHKGGLRIFLSAGKRALTDYRSRYSEALKISALLSVPQNEVSDGVTKLLSDYERKIFEAKERGIIFAKREADRVPLSEGNYIAYFSEMSVDELRVFSKHALGKVKGMLVALCGDEGDLKYVISSESIDLRAITKQINTALCGRGGGRAEMIQGSFATDLANVKKYFDV